MKFLGQAQALQLHAILQTVLQFFHLKLKALLLGYIFDNTSNKAGLLSSSPFFTTVKTVLPKQWNYLCGLCDARSENWKRLCFYSQEKL
jgi:hypothetical protein